MEFFDKSEEHPDFEQWITTDMGRYDYDATPCTASPCCSSLSVDKVSMGDVVKAAIDGLNSIATNNSAFLSASSADYAAADTEVLEAHAQDGCAPSGPAEAPSQIGSYVSGYSPFTASSNAFGFFQPSLTTPLYPVVSGTNVTPPTGLPVFGGLYSNCGLYDPFIPSSVVPAFQMDTAYEKEDLKARLKADLDTHKAGLTAQLTEQKAAIDAQRDKQRHLYRVEELDHKADNTIRVEEAREQRREARREAALCPFEDSDGYIRIEKKASGRESEFSKRILKWPHVRMHQI